jgi:hypothetical protein
MRSLHGENRRRPSEKERAALVGLPLPVDWERVRLYRVGCHGSARWLRRLVLTLSRGRAIALGNHVFLPARCDGDLAVMAHELVHCGQYQAWGPWRYYIRGASAQLRELAHRVLSIGPSPYAYQVEPGKPFESYGMEQQAQIVEDSLRGS